MKKASAFFSCLACLFLPVLAASAAPKQIPYQGTVDRIVVPANSPVQYSGMRKVEEGGVYATFQGRFLLTGTYFYGDSPYNESGEENPSAYRFEPEAYVIVDADVAKRLPHFAVRKERQIIVYIQNPSAFAKAVVPAATARRVRCKRCNFATGHIAIWVDRFNAQLECDSPEYGVRFLSVARPERVAIARDPRTGC